MTNAQRFHGWIVTGAMIVAVALELLGASDAQAQDRFQWATMAEEMDCGTGAVYSQPGYSDPGNRPGERSGGVSWTDASGALWLFGGYGRDNAEDLGRLNDLWQYDSVTDIWTWMTGGSIRDQCAFPGGGWTATPGACASGVSWTDASGALWLFGGWGYHAAQTPGCLNTLWKYDGAWTWVTGNAWTNAPGIYGVLGVPDSANTPGARWGSVSWTDASGALWLFGGDGYDGVGHGGRLNDLWRYDPTSDTWTWMKGSNTASTEMNPIPGVYGTLGTPDPANTPGARWGAVSWTDASGALWLFGGNGNDEAGTPGELNDLWKYDPTSNTWTWIKGASTCGQPGVYGTRGVADPLNTPGARWESAPWTDASGALWLFGGIRSSSGGGGGDEYSHFNDLWTYDPTSNTWTWMKGASTADQTGVYGTLGTPDAVNTPGAREGAFSWADTSGTLWLFGGSRTGDMGMGDSGRFNDLWRYDPAMGNWTWVRGADGIFHPFGTYGEMGAPDPANAPVGRCNALSWTDDAGALWLFGGRMRKGSSSFRKFNDLWRYDPVTTYWTWMKGAPGTSQPGTYGTLGVPDPTNTPGARDDAVSWTDASGALWLFGGSGYDGVGQGGRLNDLWQYDPTSNTWTWMKGANTASTQMDPFPGGVYGTLGVPDPSNTPGARWGSVSWTDAAGALWLFGGGGVQYMSIMPPQTRNLNDLWRYDPAAGDWTWMKGASTSSQSGTYGTLGVPDSANTPGARYGAVSWTDDSGALWLFGGHRPGYAPFGTPSKTFNDLWKYNPTTGNWTWMKGSSGSDQPGTYGTLGIPDPANTPGARWGAASWVDGSGALWLFGGKVYDGSGATHRFNDVWRYDLATGDWTWMKGASTTDQSGTYGTLDMFAPANTPGARSYAVAWTDDSGAPWVLGGWGLGCDGRSADIGDFWRGQQIPNAVANWAFYE